MIAEDAVDQDLLLRHLGVVDLPDDLQELSWILSVVGQEDDLVHGAGQDEIIAVDVGCGLLQDPGYKMTEAPYRAPSLVSR